MNSANTLIFKKVKCPKCGDRSETDTPDCFCSNCLARWRVKLTMSPKQFWRINSTPKAQKFIARKAELMQVDARTLQTLFNTQWCLDGFEGTWVNFSVVPPKDLALARKAGLMRPVFRLSHDALIGRVIAVRKQMDRRQVVRAFVSSLATGRLDHRSTLGSYAVALHLKPHRFTIDDPEMEVEGCVQCGSRERITINPNAHIFRRLMWAGNVSQGDLDYVLCDLEAFKPAEAGWPEGAVVLHKALEAIGGLPKSAGLRELRNALSRHIKGNAAERQVILEILGDCGVVKPRRCPSRHEKWVPRRDLPCPKHFYRQEWRSPVNCWTGRDGINEAAAKFWFGEL